MIKRFFNTCIHICLNGLVLFPVFMGIQYVFFLFSPATFYFDYKAVDSIKPIYSIGEELKLTSTSVYYSVNNITWSDTLYCDFGEGDVLYSTYVSQAQAFVQKRGLNKLATVVWKYNGELPKEKGECYIHSTITSTLKFGIEKPITLDSNKFMIQ